MATTNFTAGTVVASSWLNDVDIKTYEECVNVKMYGAVGDGVTDDATAIQAAINAVSVSQGGVVLFPPGTYLIGSAIEVTRSNTTLRGSRGAIIKLKNGVVGTLAYGSMLVAFQKVNLTFEDLTIDGNKSNNDINDNFGNGLNVYDCQRVAILNNHIYACSREGITISDHTRLDPAALGNEDIVISGNVVSDCGATSQTTGGEGILIVQGTRIVVSDNICTGNKYRGIEIETLATTPDYRGCINITVTGNVCNDNVVTGIGVNGPSRLTLTGNICENNTDYGIRINAATAVVTSSIVVNGNRINGTTGKGISVENYQELKIMDNSIQGCTTNLYFQNVMDILISNNLVSGALQHGIDFLTGTNQNLVFMGNLVRASNQSAGAYDNITGNATYAIFNGNRVDGVSARYGIATAGSSWSLTGNSLDNSGTTAIVNDTATGTRIRDNGGFITETSGTATITSGTTSVVVSHGCSKTPSLGHISVIGGEDPTNTPGAIWISSIGATQFTINVENNPGASNFDVGWRVQIA